MYRTHTCGELRLSDAGKTVTLAGWVQRTRDLGGMTFVDLRDRYGITQLTFNTDSDATLREIARSLGREYVVHVTGSVIERQSKNTNMPTGEVEITATELTVMNGAKTPPFTIEEETDGGDELRMKYRYLDLRRANVRKNFELRHRMAMFAPGAAAAGMLARGDHAAGAGLRPQESDATLRPMLSPAVALTTEDSERLAQAGINTLEPLRHGPARPARSCTLSCGVSASDEGRYLAARRLALQLANSIERGTRWVLTAPNVPQTWAQAGSQIEAFLESLRVAGAFADGDFQDCCLVVWDERVNRASTIATGAVNLLFGYAPRQPGVLQYWLVTHQPAGSRVRPVNINRQAALPRRIDWQVETTVLNG